MDKLSELFYDVGRLWNVYAPSYLNGVLNTLILAVVATLLGCVIGLVCGMGNADVIRASGVTCVATGDAPEKLIITVEDNTVNVEFVSE